MKHAFNIIGWIDHLRLESFFVYNNIFLNLNLIHPL